MKKEITANIKLNSNSKKGRKVKEEHTLPYMTLWEKY